MAGPWEKYQQQIPTGASGATAPHPSQRYQQQGKRWEADIFPVSQGADGKMDYWDTDAGLIGAGKRVIKRLVGPIYGEGSAVDEEGHVTKDYAGAAFEAATAVSPVSPGMRAGAGWAGAALTRPKPVPPTSKELTRAGGEAFNAAREIGVQYRDGVPQALGKYFVDQLYKDGWDDSNAPKTVAALVRRLRDKEGPVGYRELLSLKNALQAARDSNDGAEKKAAKFVLDRLYKFIESPDPRVLAPGQSLDDAARVARLNADARANYAAGKRSDLIGGRLRNAELDAAVANSGMNLDNRIRARAKEIIAETPTGERLRAGFSKGELALIENVAKGGKGRKTIRAVGNMLGGGLGMGATVLGGGVGYMSGALGPTGGMIVGAGVPALGAGMKSLGGALTKKAMNKADLAVRSRSPLYQEMLLSTPPAPLPSPLLPSMGVRGGMLAGPSLLDSLFQREKV